MKILKYQWVLVFFIVWLPLQGAAAAVLSVCAQEDFSAHHDTMMISDNHHHDACHKQSANTPTDHLIASLPCDDTSCNVFSNTLILSGGTAPTFTNDTSAVPSHDSGFVSFIPEQPQRPPLSAFV